MEPIRAFVTRHPRSTAALAFGVVTATVTHFAWYPTARFNGIAPALTLGAGFAHALAGAATGRRLLDPARTRTPAHATLLGAGTSLLAVALFAPVFALYLAIDTRPAGTTAYLALTLYTGLFAFLAAGWALLLASCVVGWGLYTLAGSRSAA